MKTSQERATSHNENQNKSKKQVKTAMVITLPKHKGRTNLKTKDLAQAIRTIALSTFWNHENFSEKEKESFNVLIGKYFDSDNLNNKRVFKNIVERICLTKRYLSRNKSRYISKPQDWLNIRYPKGLSGTKTWLDKVNEIRKEVPTYNVGISILANGLLKYMEHPSVIVFNRYRKMLIEQKQYDLLPMFYAGVLNQQFFIH